MMAISVSITGCKTDDESDLLPPPSTTTGLYINEVYSSNPDWVELYNSTDKEIDLSNFILQDDKGAAEEFKIPAGTKIAPKSYLILDAFSFGLSSSNGDELKLFDSKNGLMEELLTALPTGRNSTFPRKVRIILRVKRWLRILAKLSSTKYIHSAINPPLKTSIG